MGKSQYRLAVVVIEVAAFAVFGVVGLILASLGLTGIYLVSLRTHPRIRHTGWRSCGGTGEHRHPLFRWTFHRCGDCNGGRLVRWGAGRFGAGPVRNEYERGRQARKLAKQNHTWR